MSVMGRVIGGKYRHRKIEVFFNDVTRSTKDRVKEALFSAIANELHEKTCLDLFAGSGALGIEALSRGCKKGVFCEISAKTCSILEKNLDFVEEDYLIFNADYRQMLSELTPKSIDVVFLDPPYALDINIIVHAIFASGLLNEKYILAIETDKEFNKEIDNATIRKYKYGLTHLAIVRGN